MKEITIGSEKQIAWATEIRAKNLRELGREIEEFKTRGGFDNLVVKLEKAVADIESTDKPAKFWIDNPGTAKHYIQQIKKSR